MENCNLPTKMMTLSQIDLDDDLGDVDNTLVIPSVMRFELSEKPSEGKGDPSDEPSEGKNESSEREVVDLSDNSDSDVGP